MKNWTKKQVLDWFGNRGVALKSNELKAWHWEDGKLYFIDAGNEMREPTEDGLVEVCDTHHEDGSSILEYELYDTIPVEDSPLRRSTRPKPKPKK